MGRVVSQNIPGHTRWGLKAPHFTAHNKCNPYHSPFLGVPWQGSVVKLHCPPSLSSQSSNYPALTLSNPFAPTPYTCMSCFKLGGGHFWLRRLSCVSQSTCTLLLIV